MSARRYRRLSIGSPSIVVLHVLLNRPSRDIAEQYRGRRGALRVRAALVLLFVTVEAAIVLALAYWLIVLAAYLWGALSPTDLSTVQLPTL